jgi:Zn finger protein HypA/HybF involved in hydrogenase expression
MSLEPYRCVVNDVPQLKRGQVWCRKCGRTMKVDSAECLRSGWPKCCNETMTIDSPEERKAREGS